MQQSSSPGPEMKRQRSLNFINFSSLFGSKRSDVGNDNVVEGASKQKERRKSWASGIGMFSFWESSKDRASRKAKEFNLQSQQKKMEKIRRLSSRKEIGNALTISNDMAMPDPIHSDMP